MKSIFSEAVSWFGSGQLPGAAGDPLDLLPWYLPPSFGAGDPNWSPPLFELWLLAEKGLRSPTLRARRQPGRKVRLTHPLARLQSARASIQQAQILAVVEAVRPARTGPRRDVSFYLRELQSEWAENADAAARWMVALKNGDRYLRRGRRLSDYHRAVIQWRALARVAGLLALGEAHTLAAFPWTASSGHAAAMHRLCDYALGLYDTEAASAGFAAGEMPWRTPRK